MPSSARARWIGMALLVALYLWRLGAWPLVNPDEGRYAEIAREMAATGDWITPRLDGVKYFEKPPLFYWLTAGLHELGGPAAGVLRLGPALVALAGVLLAYGAVRRLRGPRAGALTALILGTSLLYLALGRTLVIDVLVSTLISAALFCFILAVHTPAGRVRRLLFYALYVAAALATLAKGLIGFLLPGAVMFLWLLLFRQWRRLRPLHLPAGLLLFLLVAAPWHVLVARRNPDWAWFYFVHEHWLRFTTTVHGRYEPWWFFVPILWLGLFPWSGLVWPAGRMVWREVRARSEEGPVLGFLAIWVLFILAFFSASDSKLVPYILPVWPAAAALLGIWLDRCGAGLEAARSWRLAVRTSAVVALLLAAGLAAVAFHPSWARLRPEAVGPMRWWLPALALVLAAGAVAAWRSLRRPGVRGGVLALAATIAAFFLGLGCAAPYLLRPGTRDLARQVAELARPGDGIFSYREYFHDFPYYSGRLTGTVDYEGELAFGIHAEDHSDRFISAPEFQRRWAGAGRIFVIVRRKDLAAFAAERLPGVHALGENAANCLFSNRP